MDRKDFIKKGTLSAFFLGISSAFDNLLKASTTLSKYRGIEGVFSPTNTHMVGDGFKVMNFFPNG
jgi:quercetin 2,3-dioxygenase